MFPLTIANHHMSKYFIFITKQTNKTNKQAEVDIKAELGFD